MHHPNQVRPTVPVFRRQNTANSDRGGYINYNQSKNSAQNNKTTYEKWHPPTQHRNKGDPSQPTINYHQQSAASHQQQLGYQPPQKKIAHQTNYEPAPQRSYHPQSYTHGAQDSYGHNPSDGYSIYPTPNENYPSAIQSYGYSGATYDPRHQNPYIQHNSQWQPTQSVPLYDDSIGYGARNTEQPTDYQNQAPPRQDYNKHGFSTQAPNKPQTEQQNQQYYTQQVDQKAKENEEATEMRKVKKISPKKVFLSVNVHGLKRWSSYKEHYLPTFEIIGTVAAEVTDNNQQGKSFILKDGQGGIVECSYFETSEFDFVYLQRGKRYRCVGCFDARSEVLRCACVSEATEEQTQMYRKSVATSNKAMKINLEKLDLTDVDQKLSTE
uniref:uncharacterized protein LOC100176238 n=1 Tax=Ciona intestinalis TaxID=7719 RepID=UPI000180CFEA|nr:uncharacterized protein LOC100176238 [Ciona intestinalis]|eukprot:XP_002121246.1 uncharacterized protein LOC100176238 [Ciona intestinalis]